MTEVFHHERIGQAHARLDQHDSRITRLETRQAVTDERFETIRASLDKIEQGQSWITRLILSAIVAAVLTFIIRGGLNVVP